MAAAPHPSGHRTLLPVGQAYVNHLRLSLHHAHNFSSLDKHLQAEADKLAEKNKGSENTQDDLGVGSEEEDDSILTLDPKEWKKHDYYKVLGLSHLRHKATPEQIKWAHRKKVLKHHPDKKAATTGAKEDKSQFLAGVNLNTNDDAFFKCISKAYEVLSNPEKRRQFDSVDPAFLEAEEDMPGEKEVKVRVFGSWDGRYLMGCYRAKILTFSRPLPTSLTSTPASPRSSLFPGLATSTPPRRRSRASMTFGTTLTRGGASNGWTRRSTRAVTRECMFLAICNTTADAFTVVTTSATPRRRTNLSAHAERRRTPPRSAASSTSPSQPTPASSASSSRRRRPVRPRSAELLLVPRVVRARRRRRKRGRSRKRRRRGKRRRRKL
jgi:curved DNA-binding protein CbpA